MKGQSFVWRTAVSDSIFSALHTVPILFQRHGCYFILCELSRSKLSILAVSTVCSEYIILCGSSVAFPQLLNHHRTQRRMVSELQSWLAAEPTALAIRIVENGPARLLSRLFLTHAR